MATFTTNYNLRKPADSDFVENDTDVNDNMDIIDSELKDREDRLAIQETIWYEASQTGTQTESSTTHVDFTGFSVVVPVAGVDDVYKVTAVVDVQNNNPDTAIGFWTVNIAGTDQTREGLWQPGGTDEARITASQTWIVTGIAAGNQTFKTRVRVSAGAFDFRRDMSILLVERIS